MHDLMPQSVRLEVAMLVVVAQSHFFHLYIQICLYTVHEEIHKTTIIKLLT